MVSVRLSVCLSGCLSVRPSAVGPSVCLSVRLPVCRSTCMYVYMRQ